MNFPSTDDFLEAFGIKAVEEDPSMAYRRYIQTEACGELQIETSFSAVTKSFQIVLRCSGREVATISSEKVKSIELQRDAFGSGVYAVFDIGGVTSEALVKLEPELN